MFEEIVSLDRGAPGNEQQGKGEIAMRSTLKGTILGAAAAGLLFAPLASASQVEDQLQAMQDRMSQMEEQLQATHDDLRAANERADHQATVIRDAGLEDERSATSALSSFLSDTEFYGWVNTSYTLNTHLSGARNVSGVRGRLGLRESTRTCRVQSARWRGIFCVLRDAIYSLAALVIF